MIVLTLIFINLPYIYSFFAGSEQQVEQTVDFQFAQTELMMNEISSGKECLVCVVVSDLT